MRRQLTIPTRDPDRLAPMYLRQLYVGFEAARPTNLTISESRLTVRGGISRLIPFWNLLALVSEVRVDVQARETDVRVSYEVSMIGFYLCLLAYAAFAVAAVIAGAAPWQVLLSVAAVVPIAAAVCSAIPKARVRRLLSRIAAQVTETGPPDTRVKTPCV